MVSFTSSSTWTVPEGVTSVRVIAIGAGGGGTSTDDGGDSNGGGGGGYAEGIIDVTGLSTVDITVGIGGISGIETGPAGSGSLSGVLNVTGSGGSPSYGEITNPGFGVGVVTCNGQPGDSNGGGLSGTLPWNAIITTPVLSTTQNRIGIGGFGNQTNFQTQIGTGGDGIVILYY